MTRPTEDQPATVPLAQQAGEILSRWRWVEPSVWTVRMLTTLEQGVEGGKWFRLFDKVFSERNLLAAFQQVASKDGAAGVDHVSVTQFERRPPGDALGGLGSVASTARISPSRFDAFTSPSRERTRHGPWGFPRSAIGWSRRRW